MSEKQQVITNLRALKRSKKRLVPGDIFVMQIRAGECIFGRLIAIDNKGGPLSVGFHQR